MEMKKKPYCTKASITLPENKSFPQLDFFYTTSYERATQVHAIYNQYFFVT